MSVKRCVEDIITNVKRTCSRPECTGCFKNRDDARTRCDSVYILFCDDCFRCNVKKRGKICNWCHTSFAIDGSIKESFVEDLTAVSFGCARVFANHFKETGITPDQILLPSFSDVVIQLRFSMNSESEEGEHIQSDFIHEVTRKTNKTKMEARELLDTFVLSSAEPTLTRDDKLLFNSSFRSRVIGILTPRTSQPLSLPAPPPSPILTSTNAPLDEE